MSRTIGDKRDPRTKKDDVEDLSQSVDSGSTIAFIELDPYHKFALKYIRDRIQVILA